MLVIATRLGSRLIIPCRQILLTSLAWKRGPSTVLQGLCCPVTEDRHSQRPARPQHLFKMDGNLLLVLLPLVGNFGFELGRPATNCRGNDHLSSALVVSCLFQFKLNCFSCTGKTSSCAFLKTSAALASREAPITGFSGADVYGVSDQRHRDIYK